MDAHRFDRIDRLLDHVLSLPVEDRERWLDERIDDPDLAREVREMLDAVEASEGFLDPTAVHDGQAPMPQLARIGAWQPDSLIGEGGTGEVWRAHRCDGRYEQHVAIKVLRVPSSGDSTRFMAEQRILARLEHPGIARLIDAGVTDDGRPFMAIEYIDGTDLMRHCREHALDLRQRLLLFRQVCSAVAFAHRHLIVHCDLKPQNILVRADGRVALLDFGIARLLDTASPDGRAVTVARFTPQYAAPEQLAGGTQSTLTDVYALGLLLHELLTDRSPWPERRGSGALAALRRSLADAPPAPSRHPAATIVARQLRGDLDAIVARALQPAPEDRYPSVDALDADIDRHLTLRPVTARGGRMGYRLRRQLRRHWPVAASVAVAVIGLCGALVAVSQSQRQAERERDVARIEAARGKAVRDYLAHMFREAGQRQAEGQPLTAKQVLDQAALRIGDEFASDPQTAAQVLQELGELHLYIDDYVGAEPLLRRWLAQEAQIADPDAAATVRFALSETLFRMGEFDEAQALLGEAQQHWASDAGRHGDSMLTSRMLESQLLRQRGDTAGALALLEASLPERLERSGTRDFQTAALLTNIGAAYLATGALAEGIDASRKALALWEELSLAHGNDALNALNNLAAGYFRSGDLSSAEQWFARAVAVRREAYGPSAATAALLSNYGRVLLQLQRHDEAVELATEASEMALRFTGGRSLLTLSARLLHAEARVALGGAEATAELASLHSDAVDAFGVDHVLTARIGMVQARWAIVQGHHAEARRHLDRADTSLVAMGAGGERYLAEVAQIRSLLDEVAVVP